MINLYMVNQSSRSMLYGIGTYFRSIASALKDSDINITIIHIASDIQQCEYKYSDGILHYYIPLPINLGTSLNKESAMELYYRNVVYLLQLSVIKDAEKKIFHLNYNQSNVLAGALKKAFDCKVITTIHHLDWCYLLNGNISRFRRILSSHEKNSDSLLNQSIVELYRKDKTHFETVDHIICLSKNTQQIIQNDYNISSDKVKVIYNGLDDIKFHEIKKGKLKNVDDTTYYNDSLRKKYHLPDMPIIHFVGRLDNIKGLIYALRAFKIVLKQQRCHFIITGNGEFELYMKECVDICSQITWTGHIDKEKLYELYSFVDICLMPSFHEQCSYVAIEMMRHGIPLIASTTTGLCEMVENNVTGLHIPVIEKSDGVEIDSNLFAEKILYLLQNQDERKRMGMNARKRYETRYSSALFNLNMLDFYESLLKK